MKVPTTKDVTQEPKKLKTPEIRVWCHPHVIDKRGSDYYYVFDSFRDAETFCKEHKEAEVPLIAFDGYEFNLYEYKSK